MSKIDRAIAPQIFTPNNIEAASEVFHKTPNGVSLYTLDFSQFDVIRLSLVFRAGTKYQSEPFLANSTASMLSDGTITRSSKEIADILDFYGIYFDLSMDRDYSVVTICSLERFFGKAMEIFEDIVLNPTFPKKELKTLKAKRKHSLKMEREKIDYIALENFSKVIYGDNHPYGVSYSESKYDDLKPETLKKFYDNHYLRDNLFAVVSGKISPENLNKIEALCDSFPTKEFKIVRNTEISAEPQEIYIEKPNSLQSAIKIGRRMFIKTHEDFVPMQFLTTVLGGYFGSRLIKNIREDKGYTYSIFAAMINMEDSGHFAISTEVASQYTQSAIDEIFKEMDILKQELVSEHELTLVRNVIIGQVLRILDGPFGIADVTIENVQNQGNNKCVSEMIRKINNTTSEQLREMARKYFIREEMCVVIVGKK